MKSTPILTVLLCRHSCDAERLVSAYNVLKDDDRSSLAAETVDAYLHVHVNMPVLSQFDVRPAVRAWFSSVKRRPHLCKKKQLISVGLLMYLQRMTDCHM